MASFGAALRIIMLLMVSEVTLAQEQASTLATAREPLKAEPQDSVDTLLEWSEEVALAAEGLQQRCGQVATELQSFRQTGDTSDQRRDELVNGEGGTPPKLASSDVPSRKTTQLVQLGDALDALRGLEAPVREALYAMRTAASFLQPEVSTENSTENSDLDGATEEALAALPGVRNRLLVCLLGVIGKVHSFLPPSENKLSLMLAGQSSDIHEKERESLAAVEALAVEEAEAHLSDAAVQFGLGLYWSDVSLASGSVAASPENSWSRDSGGASAPTAIVRAEALLLAGQIATESLLERSDRAAVRALRLYRHAEFMARSHHIAAAVWRYRAAAKLATITRRSRVPLHGLERFALIRLGYFLVRVGEHGQALSIVNEVFAHHHAFTGNNKELVELLQITLLRRLGRFQSTEELLHAEKLLIAAEGRLPSESLETERAAVLAELSTWRAVAETPAWTFLRYRKCLKIGDAARVLICTLCSVAFA